MSDEKRVLRTEFWVLSYLQTKQGLSILSLKTPVRWNLSFSIGVEQFNHVELEFLRLEFYRRNVGMQDKKKKKKKRRRKWIEEEEKHTM